MSKINLVKTTNGMKNKSSKVTNGIKHSRRTWLGREHLKRETKSLLKTFQIN